MNYFILQSVLLIVATYFLGAIVGCWLRKMFATSASKLHGDRAKLPKGVAAAATAAAGAVGAAVSTRLARGEGGEASVKISRSDNREAIPIPVEPEPEISLVRETVTIAEPVAVPQPVVEETTHVTPTYIAEQEIDDLTKIKGVGLPIALELKKIGITRFVQVAGWTDADVAAISKELGFSGRIERENWMDQAKILAAGNELAFTTHQLSEAERTPAARSGAFTRESSSIGGNSAAVAAALASNSTQARGDNLKLIEGIGAELEQRLYELGITRIEQIAALTPDEVSAVSRRLGIEDQVEQQNWIEQARRLIVAQSI